MLIFIISAIKRTLNSLILSRIASFTQILEKEQTFLKVLPSSTDSNSRLILHSFSFLHPKSDGGKMKVTITNN